MGAPARAKQALTDTEQHSFHRCGSQADACPADDSASSSLLHLDFDPKHRSRLTPCSLIEHSLTEPNLKSDRVAES